METSVSSEPPLDARGPHTMDGHPVTSQVGPLATCPSAISATTSSVEPRDGIPENPSFVHTSTTCTAISPVVRSSVDNDSTSHCPIQGALLLCTICGPNYGQRHTGPRSPPARLR